jgi:hypothetical protein
MTWEEFEQHYKPIKNSITKYPSDTQLAFETYGEEQDYVYAQPNENVWTEVDGDGGSFILAGRHFVNRFQYYITEKPWDDENQEVVIQLYKDCDECGCSGGDNELETGIPCPTCTDKHDEYNIYPDRKDLVEIYGEEANEQV